MKNNSAQKIIDSIKQILSIYKIDFDPSFGAVLTDDNDLDYQMLIEKTQKKSKSSTNVLKKSFNKLV